MKSRILIGLSALALLALVLLQYFFITETYHTKRDLVNTRYKETISKALEVFQTREVSLAFDSILYSLDNIAVEYLFADSDTLEQSCSKAFQKVLEDYSEAEVFVRDFVKKEGLSTDFSYHLQVEKIYLKDLGIQLKAFPVELSPKEVPKEALLVGSHTHVRNFFSVSYNVYINFSSRSSLVLREMGLILSLTILMLVLVFSVFFLTLRNMLRQRRLSEMKTDFINNMTHELKTPLSTISVASSSLGKPEITARKDKVEELSSMIKKQNLHLTELIDRILDINIWERDQVKLRRKECQLDVWIEGLANAFRIKQPEVELHLLNDLDCNEVLLDEVHLSTALNNLLTNAVKYGNSPCIIKLHASCKAGQLTISVSDNGPGIRREELRHVFEKFYRGHESKLRVIKGLGLGLYYVKQIVEAHGGHIQALSVPGKGASFIIQIPIKNGTTAG